MFCPKSTSDVDLIVCNKCKDRLCEAFFCLVVGSRNFLDYELLKKKLDKVLQHKHQVVIVSGGAKGADSLAEKYAKEKNYPLKIFTANWNSYGKSAGYMRNSQMHEFISRFNNRGIVAFWDGQSKGTKHNFNLAKKFNTPIRIIKVYDV